LEDSRKTGIPAASVACLVALFTFVVACWWFAVR